MSRGLLATQSFRQGSLLVALLLATLLFPKDVPGGIYALGGLGGTALALYAVGIVLIYRSNRIINFAQGATGALGATVFWNLVTYRPFLRWFGVFCGESCGSTAIAVNYWLSFLLGILISVGLSGLVYALVVRRFANAPRMLLTVATIFVVPALGSFYAYLPSWFATDQQLEDQEVTQQGRSSFPFAADFEVGGAVFTVVDVVMAVTAAVIIAGVIAFLRFSRTGVAVRASSENPDRASTLGIDVGRSTLSIWLLSGLLAGVASVLSTTSQTGFLQASTSTLVLVLTAAAIGALTSIPLTVAACLTLGMVKQAGFWAFESQAPFTGALMLVIGVSFALQAGRHSRGAIELASTLATGREIRGVPRELARHPAVKAWRRALVAGIVLLVAGSPVLLSPAQVDALTTIVILAIIAVSLLVLTGWAGQISLGQIGFAGIGAYAAIGSGLPFLLAIPLGVLTGAVTAVVVGLPALRLRGLHLAIISLAMAVTIQELLINPEYAGSVLPDDVRRPAPLGISLEDARVFYYVALAGLALVVVGVMGLRRSRTARALIAARDNDLAAQSLGVNLLTARLTAFALSGGMAAFAGVLLAYQQHAVRVGSFDAGYGIQLFQAAVVGGLGSVAGPILGLAALSLPGLFDLPSLVSVLVSGVGALMVLLLIPGGIAQALSDLRDDFLRRLAKRERIHVPALEGLHGDGDDLAPLLPRSDEPGADAYVPVRYRLGGQWALTATGDDTRPTIQHEALTGARRD